MIIGCGGAGKSTLARQLGEKTGLPVVHLDKLYWNPGWVPLSREDFAKIHTEQIAKERWLIDGNFNHTLEERLKRCDTVIYLDYSRLACLLGVLKRVLTTYGTVRPDMGEGCPERIDLEFLKWVWNFNPKNRKRYHRLLAEQQDKKIYIFKNRRQTRKFLQGLSK